MLVGRTSEILTITTHTMFFYLLGMVNFFNSSIHTLVVGLVR